MSEVLEGTTALAVSHEDQIAPARILNKFAKDSDGKFVIKSGYMDGKVMSCLLYTSCGRRACLRHRCERAEYLRPAVRVQNGGGSAAEVPQGRYSGAAEDHERNDAADSSGFG